MHTNFAIVTYVIDYFKIAREVEKYKVNIDALNRTGRHLLHPLLVLGKCLLQMREYHQ